MQLHFVADYEVCFLPEDEGAVVGADVAGGEVEADGIVVGGDGVEHYFFGGAAERDSVVVHFVELTHYQRGEVGKVSGAFQVLHHAVDVVEVFVEVFDEEYFAFG